MAQHGIANKQNILPEVMAQLESQESNCHPLGFCVIASML